MTECPEIETYTNDWLFFFHFYQKDDRISLLHIKEHITKKYIYIIIGCKQHSKMSLNLMIILSENEGMRSRALKRPWIKW